MFSVTWKVPEVVYVMAFGPDTALVWPFPNDHEKVVGPASVVVFWVVFVNNIVDPWQTVITPFTAVGLVENDAVCPNPKEPMNRKMMLCQANRREYFCITIIYGPFLQ